MLCASLSIAVRATLQELDESQRCGTIAGEGEAPAERVQHVGHRLLAQDKRHAPPHLQQRHPNDREIDSPEQDGEAECSESQEKVLDGLHRVRQRHAAHQRLSQNTFAPTAALQTNQSSRSTAVSTTTT